MSIQIRVAFNSYAIYRCVCICMANYIWMNESIWVAWEMNGRIGQRFLRLYLGYYWWCVTSMDITSQVQCHFLFFFLRYSFSLSRFLTSLLLLHYIVFIEWSTSFTLTTMFWCVYLCGVLFNRHSCRIEHQQRRRGKLMLNFERLYSHAIILVLYFLSHIDLIVTVNVNWVCGVSWFFSFAKVSSALSSLFFI